MAPTKNRANTPEQVPRNAKGHFAKGVSGNPNGRPKDYGGFRESMRDMGKKAAAVLSELLEHGEEAQRLNAARFVLEMGWGKATQALEVTGKDGGPIEVDHDVTDLLADPKSAKALDAIAQSIKGA